MPLESLHVLVLGIGWYIVLLASATFHEAAHALAAYKLGDKTAYHGGQVSLNPIPHIRQQPIGMIIIPIISYLTNGWMMGWASTPYDAKWANTYPRRSALMSLAGPSANLILVLLATLMIHVGMRLGWFQAPDQIGFTRVTTVTSGQPHFMNSIAVMVSMLFTLNLILMVFNLIPLPPLDGSGMLPLFLPASVSRPYQKFLSQPGVSLIGIIVAWRLFSYLFGPILLFAINLLYPGVTYQ
ncbi:MAG: site-2 protease family protein [Sedimentisphaerales bacterium]|nr:site-2 protease family protein [Sedimentisphaerales bacterium]